jgi:hypothetical protein
MAVIWCPAMAADVFEPEDFSNLTHWQSLAWRSPINGEPPCRRWMTAREPRRRPPPSGVAGMHRNRRLVCVGLRRLGDNVGFRRRPGADTQRFGSGAPGGGHQRDAVDGVSASTCGVASRWKLVHLGRLPQAGGGGIAGKAGRVRSGRSRRASARRGSLGRCDVRTAVDASPRLLPSARRVRVLDPA